MPAAPGYVAVVNPASGRRRAGRQWQRVEQALRTAGVPLDVRRTTAQRNGAALALEAVRAGARRLLVAGGDGSVHDVVNGVMAAGLPADDRVTLALAPLGTGNDWARGLGLPAAPRAIAAVVAAGCTRPHDVGRIEFAAAPATPRWFINVAGAGYDAHVLSRLTLPVASRHAYLAGAIRGLRTYDPPRFRIRADGVELEQRLFLALVAIGRYFGGGMQVAAPAASADGLFDVVAIRHPGLLGTLLRLPKLFNGRLLEDPVVTHLRAREVALSATPAAPVEADGQVLGQTDVVIRVLPAALDVVVPAAAALRSPG